MGQGPGTKHWTAQLTFIILIITAEECDCLDGLTLMIENGQKNNIFIKYNFFMLIVLYIDVTAFNLVNLISQRI